MAETQNQLHYLFVHLNSVAIPNFTVKHHYSSIIDHFKICRTFDPLSNSTDFFLVLNAFGECYYIFILHKPDLWVFVDACIHKYEVNFEHFQKHQTACAIFLSNYYHIGLDDYTLKMNKPHAWL